MASMPAGEFKPGDVVHSVDKVTDIELWRVDVNGVSLPAFLIHTTRGTMLSAIPLHFAEIMGRDLLRMVVELKGDSISAMVN